jgi:hypothetical protein
VDIVKTRAAKAATAKGGRLTRNARIAAGRPAGQKHPYHPPAAPATDERGAIPALMAVFGITVKYTWGLTTR